MEKSISKQISTKTDELIQHGSFKSGRVLEIRRWDDGTTVEIDVHLPSVAMAEWSGLPVITIRATDICFRDYALFGWDAETATCSLLINITDKGTCSDWVKGLRTGGQINYLSIEASLHPLHPVNLIIAIGDESSLAQLLALQQLTFPDSRFDGAVMINTPRTGQLFNEYFNTPLKTLYNRAEMAEWLTNQAYCVAHTSFYLTGNQQLTSEMHRLLKSLGYKHIQENG